MTNGNVVDSEILDFGDMKMAMGQAFYVNSQGTAVPAGIVNKQWVLVNNVRYLIESIAYSSISNQLQEMQHTSNIKPGRGSVRRMAFLDSIPSRSGAAKNQKPMKLAKAEPTRPRLVMDYVLLSSSTNLILQGDKTFFVTGLVNVTGTTTIEGGTVVKYTNSASAQITATNPVCLTGPFNPGVFSSMNDNSAGAIISGSTGTPSQNAAVYLSYGTLGNAPSLLFRNLRCSYAGQAISGTISQSGIGSHTNSVTIWDCQLINCATALYATLGGNDEGFPINAYNVLFSKCVNVFSNATSLGPNAQITFVNVTADLVGTLYTGFPGNDALAYNSLFTSVTNTSTVNLYHCATNSSSTGFYQTAGAGAYYLAAGSTYRNAGTSGINSGVLSDLQTLTTYPPVVMAAGWFTNNYTFFPQAQRDTDTPDIGFHYPPIDFAVAMAVSNATVTVLSARFAVVSGPTTPIRPSGSFT